jgi:hypothetical protein
LPTPILPAIDTCCRWFFTILLLAGRAHGGG